MKIVYCLMSIISIIVRQFFLPNPFECFGKQAIIINFIAEPFIQALSYGIVGMSYIKGSDPAWGSFKFLFTYIVIVSLLWLFGIFSFALWWILTLLIGIIIIIIGIARLKERLCGW